MATTASTFYQPTCIPAVPIIPRVITCVIIMDPTHIVVEAEMQWQVDSEKRRPVSWHLLTHFLSLNPKRETIQKLYRIYDRLN